MGMWWIRRRSKSLKVYEFTGLQVEHSFGGAFLFWSLLVYELHVAGCMMQVPGLPAEALAKEGSMFQVFEVRS